METEIKCKNCKQSDYIEYIGYDKEIDKHVFQCKYCMCSFDATDLIEVKKLLAQIKLQSSIKAGYKCSVCGSLHAEHRVFQGGNLNQVEGIYCNKCWSDICYELAE